MSKKTVFKIIEGHYQESLLDYDRALSLAPNDADSYHNRALLKYLEFDDLESAVVDMKAASKLYQEQGNMGQYQQAIELLQQFQAQIVSLAHKSRNPKIVILDLT
jgi:tetratricopeptide (TPR) repeat protein